MRIETHGLAIKSASTARYLLSGVYSIVITVVQILTIVVIIAKVIIIRANNNLYRILMSV